MPLCTHTILLPQKTYVRERCALILSNTTPGPDICHEARKGAANGLPEELATGPARKQTEAFPSSTLRMHFQRQIENLQKLERRKGGSLRPMAPIPQCKLKQ